MDYKHCCVIDAQGFYKTFVLVILEADDTGQLVEKVQYYTLSEGEQLLNTAAPSSFVRPRWDGSAWIEGATPDEIEAWEQEHPAPEPPGPDRLTTAETQITDLQLALAEAYEYADTQNTNTQLALTEVYEQLLAAQAGGGEAING